MSSQDMATSALTAYIESVRRWHETFTRDPVNSALGLTEILSSDLMELRRVRWYSINEVALEQLWMRFIAPRDDIEVNELKETVFDYYINGATFMIMDNPIVDAKYRNLIAHLAHSLSWVSRSTLTPEYVREYSSQIEDMTKILEDNHWILFLILMSNYLDS